MTCLLCNYSYFIFLVLKYIDPRSCLKFINAKSFKIQKVKDYRSYNVLVSVEIFATWWRVWKECQSLHLLKDQLFARDLWQTLHLYTTSALLFDFLPQSLRIETIMCWKYLLQGSSKLRIRFTTIIKFKSAWKYWIYL